MLLCRCHIELRFGSCADASALTWTCEDSVAIAELEVTASSLAEATAEAVSFAYAECAITEGVDDGYACTSADTNIAVWVEAVARAYATLWAGAYSCTETCQVEIEAVAEAVGSVLVDAATSAYASLCSCTLS